MLPRPRPPKWHEIRTAWVGAEVINQLQITNRLNAIGRVYAADIIHVAPRSFRDVAARVAGALPLDAAIICRHFAPHITAEAIPEEVPRERIHICESTTQADLEAQIHTWVELVDEE